MASTTEVEWDEEQRHLMLALQAYRDTICHMCGWPVKLCRDPKLQNYFKPEPQRCFVSTNIVIAQEKESANNVIVQQPQGRIWGTAYEGTT